MRLPPDASGTIRVEPPMVDGLSYALTLLYALQRLRLQPPPNGKLTFLIIGASSKAEERLMRESDYWHELVHFLPGITIELVFLGPEIATTRHGRSTRHSKRLLSRCFHGTLGDLLRAETHHSRESTIVVGFNTGFGNASAGMAKGGFALMQSWLPDLLALLAHGFVSIFSCANDYSDLRGELAIWKTLLGADFVLAPQKSPFKAATVVRESDDERCEWSCSSCYFYAICGRAEDAAPLPANDAGKRSLVEKLIKLGKQLARTQTVSPVP
jgi:hypothetical protein